MLAFVQYLPSYIWQPEGLGGLLRTITGGERSALTGFIRRDDVSVSFCKEPEKMFLYSSFLPLLLTESTHVTEQQTFLLQIQIRQIHRSTVEWRFIANQVMEDERRLGWLLLCQLLSQGSTQGKFFSSVLTMLAITLFYHSSLYLYRISSCDTRR